MGYLVRRNVLRLDRMSIIVFDRVTCKEVISVLLGQVVPTGNWS